MKLKKFFFIFTVALGLIVAMNIAAYAADSDFQFDVDSGTIKKYQGTDTIVNIPNSIGGFPVKAIGYSAFYGNDSIETVIINNNINEVGGYAFSNCSDLETLNINADKINIGGGSFAGCSNLKNVSLSGNEFVFRDEVFSGCSALESIVLPAGIKNISNSMFIGCTNLKTVSVSDTVTEIGRDAFYKCKSLENIKLSNSITKIGNSAFGECTSLKSIELPQSFNGELYQTFRNCSSLEKVSLGNTSSVSGLLVGCFSNTSIEELTFPASLEKADSWSLKGMNEMKKITILNDDIDIGDTLKYLPKDCVVYCGEGSNALKAAIGAGLKYVIIDTTPKTTSASNTSQSANAPIASSTAVVSSQKLNLDGRAIDIESYNINGNNYFKLRDLAALFNFGIDYDQASNTISINSNTNYSV